MSSSSNSNASNFLVVGVSNSGKSSVVKKEAQLLGKPIFVVGDATYSEDEKKVFKPLPWNEVLEARDCILIFEDVLTLSREQDIILRTVLDVHKHHRNVTSYVLSHRVQGTGLFGTMASFDAVWVTCSKSNVRALDQILQFFRYSEPERRQQIKEFTECKASFGHLSINPKTREIRLNVEGGEKAAAAAAAGEGGEKHLPLEFELLPPGSEKLHKLIFSRVPSNIVDPRTQTISLRDKKTGSLIVSSIEDYLYYLKVQRRPSPQTAALHKYVVRNFVIPDFVILNAYLKEVSLNSRAKKRIEKKKKKVKKVKKNSKKRIKK
jgi:hypothetical protein